MPSVSNELLPVKLQSQKLRNLNNFGMTLLGITLFGLVPAVLVAGAFLYSMITAGTGWPHMANIAMIIVGGGISALSAIAIPIGATVRQMKGKTSKGFNAWIEDTAKLSFEQFGIVFFLFNYR